MLSRFRYILSLFIILVLSALFLGCKTIEFETALIYIAQATDLEKAINYLHQSLKKEPNDIEAYLALGKAYGMQGNYLSMKAAFDSALSLIDTTKTSHQSYRADIDFLRDDFWCYSFNHGNDNFDRNRLADAGIDFGNCIIIDDKRADAYVNLALVEEKINSRDSAIAHYEKAFQLDSKNVDLMFYVSDIYKKSGNFEKIIVIMDKVLGALPQQLEALVQKAFALDQLGKSEQAIAAYQQALNIQPLNADLLFNLGRLYFLDGDYFSAIKNFEKVLANSSDDVETIILLGDSYFSLAEDIKIQLQEISKTDSLKLTQEESEQLEKETIANFGSAIFYYEQALKLKADDPDVLNMLAIAYSNVGLDDKAEAIFKSEKYWEQNKN